MTTSTQSVAATTQTGSPLQLLIGFSDVAAEILPHLNLCETHRLRTALLHNRACRNVAASFNQACCERIFDASAMTIEQFESLSINEVALKVILPEAYGELLKSYCQSMDEHTAGYGKLPLPRLNALLRAKFPNCVRVVVPNVDVNSKNARRYTPLGVAQWHGDLDIFELLLKAGADTDTIDDDGKTPLHRATFLGRTKIARLLLDAGADVNAVDQTSQKSLCACCSETPLYACARSSYAETAQLLIDRGANVNVTNGYGRTPLYDAVFRGHLEIVKILLQAGAHAKVADESGITPLHVLSPQKTRHDCFAPRTGNVAMCVEIATVLIQAGADVNATDSYGHTPLDSISNETIRELLQKHGAKTGEEVAQGAAPSASAQKPS